MVCPVPPSALVRHTSSAVLSPLSEIILLCLPDYTTKPPYLLFTQYICMYVASLKV